MGVHAIEIDFHALLIHQTVVWVETRNTKQQTTNGRKIVSSRIDVPLERIVTVLSKEAKVHLYLIDDSSFRSVFTEKCDAIWVALIVAMQMSGWGMYWLMWQSA